MSEKIQVKCKKCGKRLFDVDKGIYDVTEQVAKKNKSTYNGIIEIKCYHSYQGKRCGHINKIL